MIGLHRFITTSEHGATHDRCESSHRVGCPALRGVMQRLAFSLQFGNARLTLLRPSVQQAQATDLRWILQQNTIVLQYLKTIVSCVVTSSYCSRGEYKSS